MKMFDRVDKMFKRADEMFKRADEMFADTFHSSTTITTTSESLNPRLEYKLVKAPSFKDPKSSLPEAFQRNDKEAIEEWLNGFGADGWDLNCFEYGYAIFSRIAE